MKQSIIIASKQTDGTVTFKRRTVLFIPGECHQVMWQGGLWRHQDGTWADSYAVYEVEGAPHLTVFAGGKNGKATKSLWRSARAYMGGE